MATVVTYGVTPEGFRRKTLENIVSELETDEKADINENLDVSAESIVGQFNGVFGRQLGIAWEQLEACYHAGDPDEAESRDLEMIGKLTGTFRRGNTSSEVTLTCNLNDGTVLLAGEHFAALEDRPDVRWTPKANYTAVGTGDKLVDFECELTGPIQGLAGTINTINTPLVGWNSVVNANDAEEGLEVDTDPEFRTRREAELATTGSATVRAITANISQAFVDEIQALTVYENDTDTTDDNGLPPHSVEALIFDGDVPSVDDDAIAQVILDSKAGGIQAFGNASGTATVTTASGDTIEKVIGFSRADPLPVYIGIVLTKKPNTTYVGDAAVKEYVATTANATFKPGEDVVQSVLAAMPIALAGVKDCVHLYVGFSPSPGAEANLSVGLREIGRFSTSRITVTSS